MSSLINAFRQHTARQPHKAALIMNNVQLSYQALGKRVSNLSQNLYSAGIKSGDHVGVLLPNCVEFVVLMLAAAEMGVVLVPHNMTLPGHALRQAFTATDTQHFILWHAILEDFLEKNPEASGPGCVLVSVGRSKQQALDFHQLEQSTPASNHLFNADDECPYILTMTSGSTGAPKPIVLTQKTKYLRAIAATELYSIDHQDVILAATPLYHSLAERLVLIPIIIGATSVVLPGFSAGQWLSAVQKHQVTFSIAVSSQLKQIIQSLSGSTRSLQSLRCLVSSSERLEPSLKRQLFEHLNCDFHECYGASEIAIATNLSRLQVHKRDSVGSPAPNVEILIADDNGAILAPGEQGEILCKTPLLFSGYYKQEIQTENAMYGNFFRTGDLGRLDEDGFLYFSGRKKDVIISGGINVYPKDIEDLLTAVPGVIECAVIPKSDDRLGETVAAVIVTDPTSAPTIKQLQRHCARSLADFQQPHYYFFTDHLPRNAMGKINKLSLIECYGPPSGLPQ